MVIERWIQTRQPKAGQHGSVAVGPSKNLVKGRESTNRAVMPECTGAVMLRAQFELVVVPKPSCSRPTLKKTCQCRRVSAHLTQEEPSHRMRRASR